MQFFEDQLGTRVRLTDERLYGHIAVIHPEVLRIENSIPATLSSPDFVQTDIDDDEVRLYYKRFGGIWVTVAAAVKFDDAFVVTAYTSPRRPYRHAVQEN